MASACWEQCTVAGGRAGQSTRLDEKGRARLQRGSRRGRKGCTLIPSEETVTCPVVIWLYFLPDIQPEYHQMPLKEGIVYLHIISPFF